MLLKDVMGTALEALLEMKRTITMCVVEMDQICNHYTANTAKSYVKWLRWKQWLRWKAMRTSVRRTTASSQTTIGTTRTTSSSPSTTPMTTLTHCTCTSTDAWRTCTETARIFVPQLMMTPHTSWLKFWAHFTFIHGHTHGALSLIRLLPFLLPFPPVCLPLPPRAVP